MITKFYIFESDNFIEDKTHTNKLKDKFFFPKVFMSEYDWKQELHYIVLVKEILIKKSNGRYWPNGDCFTVMKSGEIKNPAGYGMDYTLDELEEIKFYTVQEFYNEKPKLCEKLYFKVLNDLKGEFIDWYIKMLQHYREVLRTVPELEYIEGGNKYNL